MAFARYVAVLLRTQYEALGWDGGFAQVAYGKADVRDLKFRTLDTEQDFLDWARGCFPTEYREVKHVGHLRGVAADHIRWEKQPKFNPRKPKSIQWRDASGHWLIAASAAVPSSYEGLREDDVCAVLVTNPLDTVLGSLVSYAFSRSIPLVVAKQIRRDPLHVDPSAFGGYADVYRLWAHCVITAAGGPTQWITE